MTTTTEHTVTRAILRRGPVSRGVLAAHLNLSPSTLTRLTKQLIDRGLVVELEDVTDGQVGRPIRPVDIAPDLGHVVGVQLTGTHLTAVLTDLRAGVLHQSQQALSSRAPADVAHAVARVIAPWATQHRLHGVGVALGGHTLGQHVTTAPFLGWHEVPFGTLLEELCQLPVTLENDLVALTVAEQWFGVGRELPGFCVLTIGAGVGYGLVVESQVVRTADAGTGTAGHIPLSRPAGSLPQPPACSLGHHRCATALLASSSVAQWASAAAGTALTYDDVLSAAPATPAARVLDAAATALGELIALATNLSMQHDVVLAGEGNELFVRRRDLVQEVLALHRDPHSQPVTVHMDAGGFVTWAQGAAAVAIERAVLEF